MPRTPLFLAYKRTPVRAGLVRDPADRPENYLLWGMEEFIKAGFTVAHNLGGEDSPLDHWLNRKLNRFLKRFGGAGGDWMSVIRNLKEINRSAVVFSTVDNVGIPLAVLKWLGVVKPPVIYTSIGLLEKMDAIRSGALKRLYVKVFQKIERVISYSLIEAELLEQRVELPKAVSRFVPLGIMDQYFRPVSRNIQWDIISIGSDSRRDFPLLLKYAENHPEKSVLFVASNNHDYLKAVELPNVEILFNIPLPDMKACIEASKLVVLPVRPNSYTGATTTLLQSMCLGKCIIVSAVEPIKRGYQLEHGTNCLMVEPGDYAGLESAIDSAMADETGRDRIGIHARETVLTHFAWKKFAGRLMDEFKELCPAAIN